MSSGGDKTPEEDFDRRFAEIVGAEDWTLSFEPIDPPKPAQSAGPAAPSSGPAAPSTPPEPGGPRVPQGPDRSTPPVPGSGSEPPAAAEPSGVEPPHEDRSETEPGLGLPAQWRMPTGPSPVEEVEDDYVPPPPRPLPTDEVFWVTLVCLIGGPLWLLYLVFFDRYAPALWWVLACAVGVAGLVLLIVRSPSERDDEDPDDNGAVL